MTDKARIAVIGSGWWSTSVHIPALLANPSAELAALCDADPGRLAAAAQDIVAGPAIDRVEIYGPAPIQAQLRLKSAEITDLYTCSIRPAHWYTQAANMSRRLVNGESRLFLC